MRSGEYLFGAGSGWGFSRVSFESHSGDVRCALCSVRGIGEEVRRSPEFGSYDVYVRIVIASSL